jgi:hypothetical protein
MRRNEDEEEEVAGRGGPGPIARGEISIVIYFLRMRRNEDEEEEVAGRGGPDQEHLERAHLEHFHSQGSTASKS